VARAVVLPRPGPEGDTRLVAWIVPEAGAALEAEALRNALAGHLPEHFLPAAFHLLDRLPLTASGKLDREALPAPEAAAGGEAVPPTSETESLLCRLFEEVTGAAEVGIDHGFFALGGDSISAMRLVARAQRLGLAVEVAE